MTGRNEDLKQLAKSKGVLLWKVAEQLNLTDGNFSRLLRKDLTEDKKEQIRNIIFGLSEQED